MISQVHINFISSVCISKIMRVSNGWKNHWLIMLRICSVNTEAGVPKFSVKMMFFIVSQNSEERSYFGIVINKVAG